MSYLKGKNEEKTLHRYEILYCLLSGIFKRRHRTNKTISKPAESKLKHEGSI